MFSCHNKAKGFSLIQFIYGKQLISRHLKKFRTYTNRTELNIDVDNSPTVEQHQEKRPAGPGSGWAPGGDRKTEEREKRTTGNKKASMPNTVQAGGGLHKGR